MRNLILILLATFCFSGSAFAMTSNPYSPKELDCRFKAEEQCSLELFGDKAYPIYWADVAKKIKHNKCVRPKYKVCEGL